MASRKRKTSDRRVGKTVGLLHEALGELIREKPYDEIVVQEILDRANVGRSTFYMHYQDKDDLLVSAIHELLGSVLVPLKLPTAAGRHERIIAFSLPIFEHIHRHRQQSASMMGARGRAIIHEHLQRVLADQIAHDLTEHFPEQKRSGNRIPVDLLRQFLASTFILVLNWWVESRNPLPPKEAQALFRALSLPTLAAALR